ncbi:NAD(P)/FAD-dependent oxidoreductase [Nocardia anaemiae]|uniref:NAD(P)/FAD-dependent oxidoreductase n=1 Tax=Nocardia anaemiae TaxID=263910 RepID=UPI000B21708E|nr:FAD-dependent oxidoreductase [Nocardia anaemiae]
MSENGDAAGPQRVVIVGTGQAGADTATALRMAGYPGEIVMIGEEPTLPYSRPPLSKAYLLGEVDAEHVAIRPADIYEQQRIRVITGTAVTAVERAGKAVVLADGERMQYDKLVLATGGRARQLPQSATIGAQNIHTLRTLEDADRLRDRLTPGAHSVVIGGGYIGLEFAAVARSKGVRVTVLEAADRILARVTASVVSEFFARIHRDAGVEIVVDAQLDGFELNDSGDVAAARLADGTRIDADFVLLGIGLAPRTELAVAAGLPVDDGIIVDPAMRTWDPDIYAVGDVARHPDPDRGGMRRLESVPNASAQARIAAAAITMNRGPADAPPWFWSDQYDLKLQTVGLSTGYHRTVVRADAENDRAITVFYLRDGVVVAADVVNRPADFAAAKKLVSANAVVDPVLLADTSIPLRTLVSATRQSA